MTILERKAFISSNPRIVLSSCPPPCGHFSIQESATGGLSYKVKQNPASRILRLRLVASSDIQRMFEKGFPLQCEAGNCEGTGQLPLLNI